MRCEGGFVPTWHTLLPFAAGLAAAREVFGCPDLAACAMASNPFFKTISKHLIKHAFPISPMPEFSDYTVFTHALIFPLSS